jgi:streptogramin lyase
LTALRGLLELARTRQGHGALWFTDDTGKIWRLTTSGSFTAYRMPTPSLSAGITAGPDGALWFTELTSNRIGRSTTSGVITEYPVPTAGLPGLGSEPDGIAAGPDGAIWFTEAIGNKIGRISVVPTSKEQCKKGGWRNFPGFRNQGDCVAFVATRGRNHPTGE